LISALTLLLLVPLCASSAIGAGVSDGRRRGDGGRASTEQITVLYDAFGKVPAMTKDWGFAALVEIDGRRILFDTGNNPDVFAHNVKQWASTSGSSISWSCRIVTATTWAGWRTS
jgi:hypothetical protein